MLTKARLHCNKRSPRFVPRKLHLATPTVPSHSIPSGDLGLRSKKKKGHCNRPPTPALPPTSHSPRNCRGVFGKGPSDLTAYSSPSDGSPTQTPLSAYEALCDVPPASLPASSDVPPHQASAASQGTCLGSDSPSTDPETRIWAQVVPLEGDPREQSEAEDLV